LAWAESGVTRTGEQFYVNNELKKYNYYKDWEGSGVCEAYFLADGRLSDATGLQQEAAVYA
jgi:hypothetical protein